MKNDYLVKVLSEWGVVEQTPKPNKHRQLTCQTAHVGRFLVRWWCNVADRVVGPIRMRTTSVGRSGTKSAHSATEVVRHAMTSGRRVKDCRNGQIQVQINDAPKKPWVYVGLTFGDYIRCEGHSYNDATLVRLAIEFFRTGEQGLLLDRLEDLGGAFFDSILEVRG